MGGIRTSAATTEQLLEAMTADCRRRRTGQLKRPIVVLDTNAHAISLYARDAEFARCLDAADIIHADGQFVVLASKVPGGIVIPERIATTDYIHDAARRCASEGLSFFLLGGAEEVNERCAALLQETYPGLVIAGRRNGFFKPHERDAITAEVNASGADVLWVGLGKPFEQEFAIAARDELNCGWIVTCGGCFNYITGHYARAPSWMQRGGLEWFHRVLTGPRYLVWRYATTLPHAAWLSFVRSRGTGRE